MALALDSEEGWSPTLSDKKENALQAGKLHEQRPGKEMLEQRNVKR